MSQGTLALVRNLGPLAQAVLVVLGLFSVFSWAVIVDRMLLYRKAAREGARFLEAFRSSRKFSQIRAACEPLTATPLAGLFRAGYHEISAQIEAAAGGSATAVPRPRIDLEALERELRRAAHDERSSLERGMLFLATTGSATPFIGLFGTVWGIMSAFHSIGTYGNANLAVVAPGISEALVTTAGGLAAAIPAVIAYNHLQGKIRSLLREMEDFGLEFLNVVAKSWQPGGSP